jgi:hypothetical protein
VLFIQNCRRICRCTHRITFSHRAASHVGTQTKLSSTALGAVAKHALRFLTFRGVSDALFGLYMLYWFRCFERMMGPRKCAPFFARAAHPCFSYILIAPDTFRWLPQLLCYLEVFRRQPHRALISSDVHLASIHAPSAHSATSGFHQGPIRLFTLVSFFIIGIVQSLRQLCLA